MFRELEEKTRRFYNNINSNKVKSIEEIASTIVLIHNTLLNTQRERSAILG